ncbi:MAG: Tn3 family transposase [Gammaproteobacteria bacterium]|nr:Tn3 family transposase [Gammaproteobacteria bacterium]
MNIIASGVVNTETSFMDFLRPKSSRNKKGTASIENLLACIIANGTFQEIYNFSRSSNQQYKILKRIEEHNFHEEALYKAIDTITSSAVHLPILDEFRLSDGEFHGSADGQCSKSMYNNTMVDYAAKYFGKKRGAIVYTLVTSHFAANGRVIPPRSHESHHLFDIIYNNSSQLKTNVISTDTHGTNLFNHAILNVFGYRFMLRYAHFKKRFLAEFNRNFDKDDMLSLAPLSSGRDFMMK